MAVVTEPFENFLLVRTKERTVTLTSCKGRYVVRKYFKNRNLSPNFVDMNSKVQAAAVSAWVGLTPEEKESWESVGQIYGESAPDLFRREFARGLYESVCNWGEVGIIRT